MIKSRKQMYLVIGAFALVLMLGTVTYAFFNYTRTGSANTIRTGRIAFNSQQGNSINLTNVFPVDVSNGIPNNNSNVGSVTINVTGDTTYGDGIEYLVSAINVQNTVGSGQNAKTLPISIDVSVASNTNNDPATSLGTSSNDYFNDRGGDTSYYSVVAGDTIEDDGDLLMGYIAPGSDGVDGNIVIKAYLDKAKVGISDTYPAEETDTNSDGYIDGTPSSFGENRTIFTTEEWNSLQQNGVSFKLKVESKEGTWIVKLNPLGYKVMQKNISDNGGDSVSTTNTRGVVFISGTEQEINFNYVWYSGKLWRIYSLEPNGTMKMVTENPMTSIAWGTNLAFDNSWIDNWLKEEFEPTLYNKSNILVTNAEWNVYTYSDYNYSKDPYLDSDENDLVYRTVGLLNSHESSNTGQYIYIGQSSWLLNSASSSSKTLQSYSNSVGETGTSSSVAVRPAVVLNQNVKFSSGTGSRSDPYRIDGDIETVNSEILLNNRSNIINGEFVRFNNEIYRIIGNENGSTKVVKTDVIKDNGTTVKKKLGSDSYFDTQSEDDTSWDYYLPNTWLTSDLNDWLVSGTYYKNLFTGGNYKNVKTGNSYNSMIGLPQYGEMFAAMQSYAEHNSSFNNYDILWMITPYNTSGGVWAIYKNYSAYSHNSANAPYMLCAARPTLNLKSSVKITCNSGNVCDGTYFHPYDLAIQ